MINIRPSKFLKRSILILLVLIVIFVLQNFLKPQFKKAKTTIYSDTTLGVELAYPADWQLKELPKEGTTYKQAVKEGKAKLSFTPSSNNKDSKVELVVLPTNQDLASITKQYTLYKEKEKFSANGFEWSVGEIPRGGDYNDLSCRAFGTTKNVDQAIDEYKSRVVQVNCNNFVLSNEELKKILADITSP
ncbi:MAG: hypothetical protein UR93_C0026G0002 [Berkelbacteria bacterium GW2011_GWA2_35_9]|uniref:Uncharacterized protein n=1 Tax=Berkelbacteria bacterium GW2011_GWA2_35_9 TaxID=1618333 RepID=A0A0G0DGR0_9BACT|nr:MAG: hypothetical protein UR93_C0026G0002 [Berkelbacteria bacterium GW2011_GWA2_35_9]